MFKNNYLIVCKGLDKKVIITEVTFALDYLFLSFNSYKSRD